MEKPKECPFCGSQGNYLRITGYSKPLIYYRCNKCGATGPDTDNDNDALKYWNTRPGPQINLPGLRGGAC